MCPGIIFHGRKQTVTVAISVLLSNPIQPSRTLLRRLSIPPSLSLSLSLCLRLVINYTDKPGPPAGFSSILYELVPFHPAPFCPAPRRFWFMPAHLCSPPTTGEPTLPCPLAVSRDDTSPAGLHERRFPAAGDETKQTASGVSEGRDFIN